MKVLLGILSLSVLLLSAPDAAARGSFVHTTGGVPPGLRVPSDPEPPPPPPADPTDPGTPGGPTTPGDVPPQVRDCNYCAKPDCKQCSAADLVAGTQLAYARQSLYVRGSVGDILRVDVEVKFKARKGVRMVEAYAAVGIAPVFAVTGARIKHAGQTLYARNADPAKANRKYIDTLRKAKDPLLLTPRAPGVYDLRAFPVVPDKVTTVRVTGYALAERTPRRTRLYRTGSRYLAIVPLQVDEHEKKAAFVDRIYLRSLHFLTRDEARKRFGAPAVWAARAVRCVPDLEKAVREAKRKTWVALPRQTTQ